MVYEMAAVFIFCKSVYQLSIMVSVKLNLIINFFFVSFYF